jgi:hypothetical protein
LIDLAYYGLPALRNRHEDLLNQIATLQGEKVVLSTEILGFRNSIYTNDEIISRQNEQSKKLARKLDRLHISLPISSVPTIARTSLYQLRVNIGAKNM